MFISNPPETSPPYVVGNWYNPFTGSIAVPAAPGANLMQLSPFYISRPITISDLGCFIATALAANNIQLAIYASNPLTGKPTGNPLAATGNISTASAVVVSGDIVGANVTLMPGLYWAAANHSGATSVIAGMVSGFMYGVRLVGSPTLASMYTSTTNATLCYTIAQTFGTWPDLTGGSFTESSTLMLTLVMKAA